MSIIIIVIIHFQRKKDRQKERFLRISPCAKQTKFNVQQEEFFVCLMVKKNK